MAQTSTCRAATVPTRLSPRDMGSVRHAAPPLRAGSRTVALLFASAVLVAPILAAAQGAAQPAEQSPPAATLPSGDVGMTPTRMPRPGSGAAFERGGNGNRRTAEQRFEEANTTHDGHLTEAQAKAAHIRGVATHFAEIDSHHRGYITFEEIRSWRAERSAERKAAREKAEKQPRTAG